MNPARTIFGGLIASTLLAIAFSAGFGTHWIITVRPVVDGPPPPATPNVPTLKTLKAKTLEITDDNGATQLWLTAEGGKPAVIVLVEGKPVRMEFSKLARYAQQVR